MLVCRIAFDQLLERVPELASHISKDAAVIHNRHFENGIVKIQKGQEKILSREEKEAVSCFLINRNEAGSDTEEDDLEENEVVSLIDQLKRAAKDVRNTKNKSRYGSVMCFQQA